MVFNMKTMVSKKTQDFSQIELRNHGFGIETMVFYKTMVLKTMVLKTMVLKAMVLKTMVFNEQFAQKWQKPWF